MGSSGKSPADIAFQPGSGVLQTTGLRLQIQLGTDTHFRAVRMVAVPVFAAVPHLRPYGICDVFAQFHDIAGGCRHAVASNRVGRIDRHPVISAPSSYVPATAWHICPTVRSGVVANRLAYHVCIIGPADFYASDHGPDNQLIVPGGLDKFECPVSPSSDIHLPASHHANHAILTSHLPLWCRGNKDIFPDTETLGGQM